MGSQLESASESGSRSAPWILRKADDVKNKVEKGEKEKEKETLAFPPPLHVDTARRSSNAEVTLLPCGSVAHVCKSASISVSAHSGAGTGTGTGTAVTDWDTQTTPSKSEARATHALFFEDEDDDEEDDDEDDDDEDDRIDSRDEEDEEEEDGYESGFSEGTHLRKLEAAHQEHGGSEGLSPMEVYKAVTCKVCSLRYSVAKRSAA